MLPWEYALGAVIDEGHVQKRIHYKMLHSFESSTNTKVINSYEDRYDTLYVPLGMVLMRILG